MTLFVRYSLAVQACVVENVKVGESLKRSIVLTKGSRSRILTVYTMFIVLTWVVSAALVFPAVGVGTLLGPGMLSAALVHLANFVAGALTGPLITVALSLLYYDERVRKEGLDLQLMMAALDHPAAQAAAAS